MELEATLGEQIIQAKHEILGRTVASECSEMIKNSRKLVQQRLTVLREQIIELRALRGQNIDSSKDILAQVLEDRKRYESSIPTFNQANDKVGHIGKKLLRHLSLTYLDNSLSESRQAMGDSWTTVGLNRGMRDLMKQANDLASNITKESTDIKKLEDNIYKVFQTKHAFEIVAPPMLDMSNFISNMRALEKITDDFCSDPLNVLTEKHFLIRKFFLGLGTQTQKIFEQSESECKRWLEDVLGTLKAQISAYKTTLDERTKNLTEAKASSQALDFRLSIVENEYATIAKQSQTLDTMLLRLMKAVQPAIKAKVAAEAEENLNKNIAKTLNLPEMPFISMSNAVSV